MFSTNSVIDNLLHRFAFERSVVTNNGNSHVCALGKMHVCNMQPGKTLLVLMCIYQSGDAYQSVISYCVFLGRGDPH